MAKETGFIKIYRDILDWEWYDDLPTFKLFIHLLLTANYNDKKWRGLTIKRGQKMTSLSNLSNETGLTIRQVRRSLDKLISTGEITKKGQGKGTLVTVEKYAFFQDVENSEGKVRAKRGQSEGKVRAKRGQSEGKVRATTKERKERKESKNPPKSPHGGRGKRSVNEFTEMIQEGVFDE